MLRFQQPHEVPKVHLSTPADEAQEWFENSVEQSALDFANHDGRRLPDDNDHEFARSVTNAFFIASGRLDSLEHGTSDTSPDVFGFFGVDELPENPRLAQFAARMIGKRLIREVYFEKESEFRLLRGRSDA